MDPTANLEEQRRLAAEIRRRVDALVPDDTLIAKLADQLAERVTELDTWLSSGGFLPLRWADGKGRTR